MGLWNQYDATLAGVAKTNNVSEGWHNRFRIVVGKHHPDLYSAFKELQKEQGDTEIYIVELSLGRKIKAAPKKKWVDTQDRLRRIAKKYDDYKNTGRVLDYMRSIAYNIIISSHF